MPDVLIYTDGSWKSRIQAGGWSCLMVSGPYWQILSGFTGNTTISRMELTAVATALESLNTPCNVTVVSDSQYVVKSINEWIRNWYHNNWKTSKKTTVDNVDLMMRIATQMLTHNVRARWIKAHTRRKGIDYLGNGCVDWFAQYNANLFR